MGADLAALHRHATLASFDRAGGSESAGEDGVHGLDGEGGGRLVSWGDVDGALRVVRPSALREVELKVPLTRWEDIGGQARVETVTHARYTRWKDIGGQARVVTVTHARYT